MSPLSLSLNSLVYFDTTRRASQALKLQTDLERSIVGQSEAVGCLADVYQTYLANLCVPGRPLSNLLFLGPTGTGKTRIVEAAAESLLGTSRAVVKIDCAEFQHSHEIAKLIGSPPGYLGHRETKALLSQEVLNASHTDTHKVTFVLFDEIEKASDSLWNLLLGILDKATLTLGDNRQVNFERCFVIMTANLGSAEMNRAVRPFGFEAPSPLSAEEKRARNVKIGTNAAKLRFSPEFFNRLDKIVTFNALDQAAIGKILEIELDNLQRRLNLLPSYPQLVYAEGSKQLLIDAGFDEKYGARHLKRALQRLLVQPISNLIGSAQVKPGEKVLVVPAGTEFRFARL